MMKPQSHSSGASALVDAPADFAPGAILALDLGTTTG